MSEYEDYKPALWRILRCRLSNWWRDRIGRPWSDVRRHVIGRLINGRPYELIEACGGEEPIWWCCGHYGPYWRHRARIMRLARLTILAKTIQ